MQRILLTLTGLLLLFLFWLLRPDDSPPVVTIPANLPELNFTVEAAGDAVRRSELRAGPLKADNHARIVWNPEYRNRKAPCSLVYIHGFTASYGEGSPFHVRTARELGCNLYVARLHGHGLRTDEPLRNMNPDSLIADAAEALAIGNLIGDRVILTGNSMGGILAMHLAAEHPESVDVLVLLAPLLDFASPTSYLFDKTWGQRLMQLILREPYLREPPDNDDHARYWYNFFHIESLMQLTAMKKKLLADDPATRIRQPVFTGYYYKDEWEQDEIVSVSTIQEMEYRLATSEASREFRAFPDIDSHVITSAYRTTHHGAVSEAVISFLKANLPDG